MYTGSTDPASHVTLSDCASAWWHEHNVSDCFDHLILDIPPALSCSCMRAATVLPPAFHL
jgi:hypothetical protein